MSVHRLLAIGLASAGIGVTFALAGAPLAAAAPKSGTSSTTSTHHWSYDKGNRQLVRNSAKAVPGGSFTAKSFSTSKGTVSSTTGSSSQGGAPTSWTFLGSPVGETQGANKHHFGNHHGH